MSIESSLTDVELALVKLTIQINELSNTFARYEKKLQERIDKLP